MRRQLLILTATLGLFGVLATTPVFAQGNQVRVTIPFQFMVENQVMPAGHYLIQTVDIDEPYVMLARNVKTNQACIFLTEPAERLPVQKHTDVLFLKDNGNRELSRIWISGNEFDFRVIPVQALHQRGWLLTEMSRMF